MYGMLLESIQFFIQKQYGQTQWQQILEHAGIRNIVFATHSVYNDDTMALLAAGCAEILKDKTQEQFLRYFGHCFVFYFSNYGYDKIIRVSGRCYRDFLHEINNIHEMMRYSFSNMRSPSFLVISEDCKGCDLRYRSNRSGFHNYVIGQLTEVARKFYELEVSISILSENKKLKSGTDITFRMNFDNSAYSPNMNPTTSVSMNWNFISSGTFFKVFPFCVVFDERMVILQTGQNMSTWLDTIDLLRSYIYDRFSLRRPLFEFTWNNVIAHQTVIFELQYRSSITRRHSIYKHQKDSEETTDSKSITDNRKLIFRGQMKYISSWDAVAFLCTPLVGSIETMREVGLYLNDLNLFDNSRDMVVHGWHHASQLELLVEQQQAKSCRISTNMRKIDEWTNKSNTLLYSMIPETIANRLKKGDNPIKTCETFDQVTILFCYIVGFTEICSKAKPMDIVKCINSVFSAFDAIVDKYDVFKVETLGDAVYMVAGGVPDRKSNHAESVAGLALELVDKATILQDPITNDHLQVKAGMHTGGVVGGIIGKRMPQYCLFGDTVNTASRMQSYSEPGRIHVSEPCNECLKDKDFTTVYRGTVNVKGKGEMNTYWLAGRQGEEKTEQLCELLHLERKKIFQKYYSSFENGYDLHGLHQVTSGDQLASLSLNTEKQDNEITENGNHEGEENAHPVTF